MVLRLTLIPRCASLAMANGRIIYLLFLHLVYQLLLKALNFESIQVTETAVSNMPERPARRDRRNVPGAGAGREGR